MTAAGASLLAPAEGAALAETEPRGRRPGFASPDGVGETNSPATVPGAEQQTHEAPERLADLLGQFVPDLDRDEAEAYVHERIAFKVGRILEKFGLDGSQREDFSQDLLAALVRVVPRYDGKRTRWKTFVSRVLDQRYRNLIRKLLAPQSGVAARPIRFTDVGDWFEEAIVDPRTAAEPFAAEDLRMDVESVIGRLPEDLQIACRLLMAHPRREAARLLGVSPSAITRMIRRARPVFEQAGLTPF